MDQSEFGQFVAALWERQGWQTQVKNDDGRTFVAVQRPNGGEEGLLWAIPDGEVGGQQVQQFAKLCQQYEVSESAIVTAGTVSDHAEKVSQGSGVELLDGEGVARILKQKEWTDLAEEYGDGGANAEAETGGATSDGDGSPLDQLRAVGDRLGSKLSAALGGTSVPAKPAVAVVLVVALLAAGVLSGVSIPFLGGGGGPVSAESVSPANSTTTLSVAWNARVTDTIDPDESDGKAYPAPRGKQFVLVKMRINNTGDAKTPLKKSAFKLRTANRTYGHQPLAEHEGFIDFPISPNQRYVGWLAFAVPEGSSGTLIYDQNATGTPVTVEFTRDSSIDVNVSQR
ncbi:restriction endonuclease [Halorussus gelatinilyticus]|uniref:Restriction endonuclease n=1 Tax=Halorussus gelatinilyticus TaxID=2937524 RepID=A0A8U0ILP6_9EURY|nr:restriction endonuclease [Halorussus gelatinilyticus]UPW01134.1 restriction endonuclease [Halorussus gelatinilyticus]